MSSLGVFLREVREAKGVSLDDIARSTRIGRGYLEALETDSWGELPSPVFVKGFIRAYCGFLDASPEEALGLYREATGETVKIDRVQSAAHAAPSRRVGPLMVSLVLFIALGASLFALRLGLKSSPRPSAATTAVTRSTVDPVPASPPTSAVGAPVGPAESTPVQAGEAHPSGHRLLIRALEATWIRVQVDDGQAAEELLQAGAVREWAAARKFVLTVGNAGGVEVDYNGRRIPALGARGVVIQKLVLPADALETGS